MDAIAANGSGPAADSPIDAAPLPEVRNHTRFPAQYFQMIAPDDKLFHVLVCRMTFDLNRLDGAHMPELSDEQPPLIDADRFYGEPNLSSIEEESDFAPFKPKCDVLVTHATAHAPKGRAEKRWPVGIRVGEWSKTLAVTGPRHMNRNKQAWHIDEPQAAAETLLRYEWAFGGTRRWPLEAGGDEEPELLLRYDANPIGAGYAPPQWCKASDADKIDAPRIELLGKPFDATAADAQDYPPAGFGAVGRWWSPRVALAGTYDSRWKEERWPRLPRDFDFAYWNGAPLDQQIAWPKGGEPVALTGLMPGGGQFHASVPGNSPFTLLRLRAGPSMLRPMRLDTLVFNLRAMTLACVYRMTVAAKADVRVLELRRRKEA